MNAKHTLILLNKSACYAVRQFPKSDERLKPLGDTSDKKLNWQVAMGDSFAGTSEGPSVHAII